MQISGREGAFIGCLLGLALGDAFGAPHEGGWVERAAWRVMGRTADGKMRWTDDTQMAIDLAESLSACTGVDQDDIARRFARGYRWSRGYGPGAARVLKLIRAGGDWRSANTRVFREGSFGNGGAMRAPMVGLFFAADLKSVATQARATAVITHAHPLGQEGAALVALATAMLINQRRAAEIFEALLAHARQEAFRERLAVASSWFKQGAPSPDAVRRRLGNGIAAVESCVTAIYVALQFLDRPFTELLDFVAAGRGDVDTIGAMAGAIWGAYRGESALPRDRLERLEGERRLRRVAGELLAAAPVLS